MSDELGSGHFAVVPTMRGFRSAVTKEATSAGLAGAKATEGGFRGVGQRLGRSVGRDLKASLAAAAADAGAAEVSKLTRDVAAASAALSKVRLRQQDDAGRVRVAEVRLQEAIKKSGEDSSQAAAAAERVASARRAQQVTADAAAAATERLRAAQETLARAQTAVAVTAVSSAAGMGQLLRDFRSGFSDLRAGQSSFTGLAGSLGGLSRALLDVTGFTYLGRLAAAGAARVSSAFVSMATMVGGGLAKALTAAKAWAGRVGSTVRGAFAPYVQYAAAAATVLASPFVRLGSRVATWLSPVATQVAGVFRKLGPAIAAPLSRISSAVAGIAGPVGSAASRAFQGIVSAASRAASAAGRAVGSGIQSAATTGVTVAAAGIGVALGKGFSRLTSIDTARAKLTGLGNDAATVQTVMGDALASVRGTSFGLGDAATVAASAVAAGIKPGEALQAHLKSIANNASAAGVSMGEMGSIFNKAATQANGVQNDVISQLADKGIPIYQALADQLGVTAGEVFDMASDGKIDFETFSKAATKAAGTVADEMGKTVPGAAKNFLAAMGRIGANALQPIYGKIAPLIQAATSALGPIEDRAKALGGILLKVLGPAFDAVTGFLNRLGQGASIFTGALAGMQGIIGPVAGAFAALGAGGLGTLLSRIPLLTTLIPGLTGALGLLGGPLGIVAAAFAGFALTGGDFGGLVTSLTGVIESVVAALPGLAVKFGVLVPQIVSAIVAQIPQLLNAGVNILDALVQGLVSAIPQVTAGITIAVSGIVNALVSNLPLIVGGALNLFAGLARGLIQVLPVLITTVVQLVVSLVQGLVALLPTLVTGALQLFMGLVTAVIQVIPVLLTAIIGALPQILTSLLGMLPALLTAAMTLFLQLVLGLVQVIPDLLTTLIGLLPTLLTTIIGMIPMLLETVIQLFLQLVLGLLTVIPQLLVAIVGMLPQIITTLISLIPTLLNAGIELFKALVTAIPEMLPQLKQTLTDMGPAMVDAILALGPALLDAGKAIIQSLIDGIGSMFGDVGNALGGLMDFVGDFFPHSPAKRGPLSGSGWYALRSGGAAIAGQMAGGIGDGQSDVARASAAMAAAAQAEAARVQALIGSVSSTITVKGTGGPGVATPAAAPSVVQNNNFAEMDPEVAVVAAGQSLAAVARRAGA
jgi:tape measure domain-containing protein